MAQFYFYILASRPGGTLYAGVTRNLIRRVYEHRNGLIEGHTKRYRIHQLVYFEEFASIIEARAREHALKRWRRAWKIQLIEKLNPDWRDLSSMLNG